MGAAPRYSPHPVPKPARDKSASPVRLRTGCAPINGTGLISVQSAPARRGDGRWGQQGQRCRGCHLASQARGSRGCRWAGSVAPSVQHRERRHAAAAQLGERDKVPQGSQGGKTVFKRQGSPPNGLGLKARGVFAAMNNPGAAARGLLPVPCSRRCSREGGWRWGRDPNPQLSPLDVPTPAAPQLA